MKKILPLAFMLLAACGSEPMSEVSAKENLRIFPAILEPKFFIMDSESAGHQSEHDNEQLQFASQVAVMGVIELGNLYDKGTLTNEVDDKGNAVEVVKNGTFESRQTYVNNVQSGMIMIAGQKRYAFTRDFNSGKFEGVLIAKSFSVTSPLVATVIPNGDGTATQTLIVDVSNEMKMGIRGDLIVSLESLDGKRLKAFEEFKGGLKAQRESEALVSKF